MSELGWLQKMPIVSLLFAAVIVAVFFMLAQNPTHTAERFEVARGEARDYFIRNSQLEVDSLGELMLDPIWLGETREAAASSDSDLDVRLPPRMLARSQARLDGLIERAYEIRMIVDPAWRLGVLDGSSPQRNYIVHAFVHETLAGVILSVLVLLLIGAPLERTWGSSIFAGFVFGSIPVAAQAYRVLDASSGVPWSGAAGLAGALLGAYFIRSLGGQFVLPGWVVLPVWLGVESFVVRGFWLDDLGRVPWATLCAAIGFGALVAGSLRLMNFEARVDERASKRIAQGPNPIVARVARMRSDGDPYQAFDLIQAAWRDDPKDVDVCEAFYSIAVEIGQPEVAAEAILPQLRKALKEGRVQRAIDYWFPLASKGCIVELEPTASVRLGEALLDAGHPQEALFSLRLAIDTGVSSAHATRIVNIARDLDAGLTRQAAKLALSDPGLNAKIRADLELLLTEPSSDPPEPVAPVAAAPPSRSQLDRRVQAEHQSFETTLFPLEHDSDLESHLDVDFKGDLADLDGDETVIADLGLDPGSLFAENLAAEVGTPAPGPEAPPNSQHVDDVLSHWNDKHSLSPDVLADVSSVLDEDGIAEALLDPDDLETPDMGFDFGLRAGAPDLVDPLDDETDSDFTPMIDSTDELTNPMARGSSDKVAPVAAARDEFAFGGSDGQATSIFTLRTLKALDAVPLEASGDGIEIDANGRGKSKLPYSRIQAISMVAVLGLGPRPVLVLDLVLNWRSAASEPMKLIRFRSDRFNPLEFSPGAANPLAALTAWVIELESRSGGTCLPAREVLEGRFKRYASLETYEREVLMASA